MMNIQMIEHDPLNFRTNIDVWAANRGHVLSRTEIFRGEPFPDPDHYDWLMVMGGSQHAWEESLHPWLVTEKAGMARALEHRKMILGICFGAQLLSEALGGRVFPQGQKEIGWYPVRQTPEGQSSPLLQTIPGRFLT
ncbi:MAG: type 1 glutamine amidotransferase, partial [Deltaproteobacteria bacterium]|nr:type 1 glutamine amidotransferase [Deltaproteobacteria bacterium]